ncbi:MAG: dienelactone hydrolase family protein [Gemmatimonadota bacterium]|nr:dienelactone hydrolase family protein [Gemmatimonadota bacterium]MDH3479822.1 dienelactone hydrolase family protein [Gemmatimonadota bacterium]MDH3569450.1 dienelactone hydrolase family protein [Gemmatimonadota bacterium]MDH5550079.1 dienelactone hydrolase family protein [Gemmatimonadota bacterium]
MTVPTPRTIATPSGEVSGLFSRPSQAEALLVLAHGAGAGMTHPFMAAVADALAAEAVATLRYQFPSMEAGRRRPDTPSIAMATVRAAVQSTAADGPLLVVAGGKSFGGRMSSEAAAKSMLPHVRGLVFFGFPLHPPGKPGRSRAAHLAKVRVPMLFVQGTRDALAQLPLVETVVRELGARATLHVVDGGDHSFKLPKRLGRDPADVINEIGRVTADWIRNL